MTVNVRIPDMKKIKITLEYGCSPIWDVRAPNTMTNLVIESLPVSLELQQELRDLNQTYHDLFINNSQEFRYKGFDSPDAEAEFNARKENVVRLMKQQLPATWVIDDGNF